MQLEELAVSGKKTNVRAGGQPAAQVVPGAQTPVSEPITKKDQIWIAAYAVLLFLAMTVQTGAMTLFLTVLALDFEPVLKNGFTVEDLNRVSKGHILAKASIKGVYSPKE